MSDKIVVFLRDYKDDDIKDWYFDIPEGHRSHEVRKAIRHYINEGKLQKSINEQNNNQAEKNQESNQETKSNPESSTKNQADKKLDQSISQFD